MSDRPFKHYTQDMTPKRTPFFQNSSSTQVAKPAPVIYNTPDKLTKSPYRQQHLNTQCFNDTYEIPRYSQYPPTYQSSQISLHQQNLLYKQENDTQIRRDPSPISQDSTYVQLVNTIEHLKQSLKQKDQMIEQLKKMQTDRIRPVYKFYNELDEFAHRQKEDQNLKVIILERDQLKDQIKQQQKQIQEAKNKQYEQEAKYKDMEQKMKEKEHELKCLLKDYEVYKSQSIHEQQLKQFFEAKVNEVKAKFKELIIVNDHLRDENNALKMNILQGDNALIKSNFQSKKNSEQDFQIEHVYSDDIQIREMVNNFIFDYSNELLGVQSEKYWKPVLMIFKETFRKVFETKDQNQEERQFKISHQMSNQHREIEKAQDDEMLGIIELKRKYERVKREIEGKRKLLHTSNEITQAQIGREIREQEQVLGELQALIAEQSDLFEKANLNVHRNSVISFDQNFEAQDDSIN